MIKFTLIFFIFINLYSATTAGIGIWQGNISGYTKSGNDLNYFSNSAISTDSDDNTSSNNNYDNNNSNSNNSDGNLNLSSNIQPYIWVKVTNDKKHFPNIKFLYTRYHSKGEGKIKGKLQLFGKHIGNINSKAKTTLDINSLDTTFFYRFNIKHIAELEAGIGANILITKIKVKKEDNNQYENNNNRSNQDTSEGDSSKSQGDNANSQNGGDSGSNNSNSSNSSNSNTNYNNNDDDKVYKATIITPIPYLYARIHSKFIKNFTISSQAKYLKLPTLHYYDYQGGVHYILPVTLLDRFMVKSSIYLGYKYQDIMKKNGDDVTKLNFKGAFAEIDVKF